MPSESDLTDCAAPPHPNARKGIDLFNAHHFFEAHEELEIAWKEEHGSIRDLYRGILQVAVTYLHIIRGNYNGAIKVYGRSQKWMQGWAPICRGLNIAKLNQDAALVINEVRQLGSEGLAAFNTTLLKPIEWHKKASWLCDRCGTGMYEKNCKITCPNCGNRFDCSDLNLYFDE